MMGRQTGDQSQLFYLFNLEQRIPAGHLLRRINPIVTQVLAGLREKLAPFYSEIGRPSIDPELMLRMLIVGYCYGIRFERRLCEEVDLHLAYRWFCRLDLDDTVPDHSTFSVNRHGRFRDSDILRHEIRRPIPVQSSNKEPQPSNRRLFQRHRPIADMPLAPEQKASS
jgi:transposase